jgi:hypothetical protein
MAKILDLREFLSKSSGTEEFYRPAPGRGGVAGHSNPGGEEQCPAVTIFYRCPENEAEICHWARKSPVIFDATRAG